MHVQVSCCLWGLWRKAQHTSWSCLIKALTGPDYMSQPGGGVCVSFLRWRKSIWWERGGAVPVGVIFFVWTPIHTLWGRRCYHYPLSTAVLVQHQTNILTQLIYLTTPVPPDTINTLPTNHDKCCEAKQKYLLHSFLFAIVPFIVFQTFFLRSRYQWNADWKQVGAH